MTLQTDDGCFTKILKLPCNLMNAFFAKLRRVTPPTGD